MKRVKVILIKKKLPISFIRKIPYNTKGQGKKGFKEIPYMIFKGTVIVFFEDSGISLIVFSEKSCGNPKGGGEMKEIPYRLYRKKLYE